MTEVIVLSKPRTRFVKWRGGIGYHMYMSSIALPQQSDSVNNLSIIPTTTTSINFFGTRIFAQQFWTPNRSNLGFRSVAFLMSRVGNPTGTLTVELRNDASTPTAGSLIGTIGSMSISSIPTSATLVEFTTNAALPLAPNTRYWIIGNFAFSSSDSNNYISIIRSNNEDVHANANSGWWDGFTWSLNSFDYRTEIGFRFVGATYTATLDFQYIGHGIKRLEDIASHSGITITNVTVNGTNVGSSLTRDDNIPQSSSYSLTYTFNSSGSSYTIQPTIQRYLLFIGQVLTLEDLGGSEAYVTKVTMGSGGGHLRIDDDPSSELFAPSSTSFVFETGTVPFRKLEWLAGSGDVDILVVE